MTTLQQENTEPKARRFYIDALNVAYWCGNPPSLRLPISLLILLLQQGHEARLYFDASAPYRFAAETALYQALMQHTGQCLQVPSGRSADGVLLRDARAHGACIISRDHYRDHRRRYRKLIDDPMRRFAGFVLDNHLQLPMLGLHMPLPQTAQAAWQDLLPLLVLKSAQPIAHLA